MHTFNGIQVKIEIHNKLLNAFFVSVEMGFVKGSAEKHFRPRPPALTSESTSFHASPMAQRGFLSRQFFIQAQKAESHIATPNTAKPIVDPRSASKPASG